MSTTFQRLYSTANYYYVSANKMPMDIPDRFGLYTGTCPICRALHPLLHHTTNPPTTRAASSSDSPKAAAIKLPTKLRLFEYVYKSSQTRRDILNHLSQLQQRRNFLPSNHTSPLLHPPANPESPENNATEAANVDEDLDWLRRITSTRVQLSPTVHIALEWRWCEKDGIEEPMLCGEPICVTERRGWSKRLLEAAHQLIERERSGGAEDGGGTSDFEGGALVVKREVLERTEVQKLVALLQRIRWAAEIVEEVEAEEYFPRVEDDVENKEMDAGLEIGALETEGKADVVEPTEEEETAIAPVLGVEPLLPSLVIEESIEEAEREGEKEETQRDAKPTNSPEEAMRGGEKTSSTPSTPLELAAETLLERIAHSTAQLQDLHTKISSSEAIPTIADIDPPRTPNPITKSPPSTPHRSLRRQTRSNSIMSNGSYSSIRTPDEVLTTIISNLQSIPNTPTTPRTPERSRSSSYKELHSGISPNPNINSDSPARSREAPWWVDYSSNSPAVEEEPLPPARTRQEALGLESPKRSSSSHRPYSSSSHRHWSSLLPRRLSSAHSHRERPTTPKSTNDSTGTGQTPASPSPVRTPNKLHKRPPVTPLSAPTFNLPVPATTTTITPENHQNHHHHENLSPFPSNDSQRSRSLSARSRRNMSKVVKKVERKLGFGKDDTADSGSLSLSHDGKHVDDVSGNENAVEEEGAEEEATEMDENLKVKLQELEKRENGKDAQRRHSVFGRGGAGSLRWRRERTVSSIV